MAAPAPCLSLLLDCQNELGESILWDDRRQSLWWVNIHKGEVWNWNPAGTSGPSLFQLPDRAGALGLCHSGDLVVALASRFVLLNPDDGSVEPLAKMETAHATTRLNDGRVDPVGRFVCGGMDEAAEQQPLSAVYSLQPDRTVRQVLPGVHCTNSICWSPDGCTFYFTDMPSRRIEAFDYDLASGSLSNRRLFASLEGENGLADGSVVDAEGFLWNAQWGGGKLQRFSPDGRLDREIVLPVSRPTCMAFGGPEFDTLFVTTAWFGLAEAERRAEPMAGGLFALKPGVRGLPEHRYAG